MKPEDRGLVLIAAVTAVVVVVGAVGLLDVLPVPTPATSGTTTVDGTAYSWESVRVAENPLSGPSDANQTAVDFHGVHFRLFIYDTMDCPVLSVNGTEPSGVSGSFLIAPIPMNCEMRQPTVLSPDGAFGATWQGTSTTVLLLVRVS